MAMARGVGRTASSVGMMEGAFFVSRSELLHWVNSLLNVNLAKVEQCSSGAVYCQILDACHPGTVAMRKVNWMARTDHEHIPNYKVLQAAFDRNSIEKYIDVDKLIRGKYQDNLEFLQWMKCYWERQGGPGRSDYDPVQSREGRPVPPWARPLSLPGGLSTQRAAPGEKENQRPPQADVSSGKPLTSRATGGQTANVTRVASGVSARGNARHLTTSASGAEIGLSHRQNDAPAKDPAAQAALHHEVEELRTKSAAQEEELTDLRSTLDGLERERDYYFRKLRSVEILCTTLQERMDPQFTAEKIITDIQGILYAEGEDADDDEPLENVVAEF
mmetsp:Transcript_32861/g.71713  ORF Transcript_32861/g.71713 Transcript_32861/m.71713 type:complete len:332 (-) Transcript_32861:86-1081(-)|eukprot:CAMPEP_0170594834 /NCGR_PEP_ID=MMETSP0224-20130122/14215_1 /TAXON_ID=285029 /ORGANISM="Togula jolla, Strain CCCM 725" /LENGTH=331 /DNA_ID=CAMNT_0010918925 /DNA_START=63 /DNA_END=1058 /DNA_ORIENTATION=+